MDSANILKAITQGSRQARQQAVSQLKKKGGILFLVNGVIEGLGITESEARSRYPDAIIFRVANCDNTDLESDPIE